MKRFALYFWSLVVLSLGLAVSCGPKINKPKINTDATEGVALLKVNSCAAMHREVREYQRVSGKLNACVQEGNEPEVREINFKYLFRTLNEQRISLKLPIAFSSEGISEENLEKIHNFVKSPKNPCLEQIERIFSVSGMTLEIEVDPSSESVNTIPLVDRTEDDEVLRYIVKNAYYTFQMMPDGTSECRSACDDDDEDCPMNCALQASKPFCRGLLAQVGHHLGLSDTTANNHCLTAEQQTTRSNGSIFSAGEEVDDADDAEFWNSRRLGPVDIIALVTPICQAGEERASAAEEDAEEDAEEE